MKIFYPALFLIFFACGSEGEKAAYPESGDLDMNTVYEVPPTNQTTLKKPPVDEEITQKVVKRGGIDFQSENIEEDYIRIRELLPKYDAYIESENQTNSPQRISYNLTLRVPSEAYDTLYTSLSTLAFRLYNRYSNIEDVTERYYDLKTRIENKKALEARYRELLGKASEIKDILEIERNLNEVRTDIERLQGQFNYLSKQVSFSTIHVSFYEVLPYIYDTSNRKGFGARIMTALDSGWQGFLTFLVRITMIWPFVFLVILGVFFFRRLKIRKKEKK